MVVRLCSWIDGCRALEPPKLKRFLGKPTEFSPKARIMNALGWCVSCYSLEGLGYATCSNQLSGRCCRSTAMTGSWTAMARRCAT